jgi:hypothetical protein
MSFTIFTTPEKIIRNSSLPSNMPEICVQRTGRGASARVRPTDKPTVPSVDVNSKKDSFKPLPYAVKTPVPMIMAVR